MVGTHSRDRSPALSPPEMYFPSSMNKFSLSSFDAHVNRAARTHVRCMADTYGSLYLVLITRRDWYLFVAGGSNEDFHSTGGIMRPSHKM